MERHSPRPLSATIPTPATGGATGRSRADGRSEGGSHMPPWTDTEIQYLRENYDKMRYADIAAHLGRSYQSIATRVFLHLDDGIDPRASVPMEQALSPDQCDKMRTFLRAWLTYGKRGEHPSATRFLKAWRMNEFGRVKAYVERGPYRPRKMPYEYKPKECRLCGEVFTPASGTQLRCQNCIENKRVTT